jgi:hypothetical protein
MRCSNGKKEAGKLRKKEKMKRRRMIKKTDLFA